MTVAALFIDPDGVYANLPDVEVWDEARDARKYAGPWPVVAHPPCARWSRLAGFTEARFGYKQGEDHGCFEAALNAVRTRGGVLEHPAYSKAWDRYGLPEPVWRDGWSQDLFGGASCYIEQGRYGLPVKKATWLYVYGVDLPELKWGFTLDMSGPDKRGPWGGIDNWRDRNRGHQTTATPIEFRDALLAIARSARNEVAA